MSVQDKRVVVNNVAAMDPLERYNNPYVSRVPLDIHATTEKVKFSPMCFVLRCLLPALLVEVSYSREVWIIPWLRVKTLRILEAYELLWYWLCVWILEGKDSV